MNTLLKSLCLVVFGLSHAMFGKDKGIDDSVSGRYVIRQAKNLEISVLEQDIKDEWQKYLQTHFVLKRNLDQKFQAFRDKELRKKGYYKKSDINVRAPKVFQEIYTAA